MYVRKQKTSPIKLIVTLAAIGIFVGIGYYKFTPRPAAQVQAQEAKPHVDTGLQQIVNTWGAQQTVGTSVTIQELTGSLRTATRNDTASMPTASTYKLFIAYAVLRAVEQGKYTMNTRLGNGQTIATALDRMVRNSDNDSGKALGTLIGWKNANAMLTNIGITNTNLYNYNKWGTITEEKQTTADDLALLLKKLQGGTLLKPSNAQLLLDLMKNQNWRERVPAGVPEGVEVADKPGWLANTQNDAAIVYGPKSTYIIVILTSGSTTQPLADLSKLTYDYLEH